jgi:hypothetical protein
MYHQAGYGVTAKPQEAGALSNFGIGLTNYRHYIKSKIRGGSDSSNVHLLDSANNAFMAALEQDPEFYLARIGSALVYKAKSEILEKRRDNKKRQDCLSMAISQLQHAKDTAEDLSDMNSVKWIDKRVLYLEHEKRSIGNTEGIWARFLRNECPDSNAFQDLPPQPKGD